MSDNKTTNPFRYVEIDGERYKFDNNCDCPFYVDDGVLCNHPKNPNIESLCVISPDLEPRMLHDEDEWKEWKCPARYAMRVCGICDGAGCDYCNHGLMLDNGKVVE